MSIFKKFVAPLTAVALVAVVGVSLLTNTRTAYAAASVTTLGAVTAALSTNETTGTNVSTALTTQIVLSSTQINEFSLGTIVLAAPSGWEWNGTIATNVAIVGGTLVITTPVTYSTSAGAACALATGCANMVLSITTASATAATTVTIGGVTPPQLRPISNTTATGNITVSGLSTSGTLGAGAVVGIATATGYGVNAAPYATVLAVTANAAACGTANPVTAASSSFPADGSVSRNLCASVTAADGGLVVGATVTFTVSTGFLGSGTTKTGTGVTNAAGNANIAYRGGGGVAGSDTAIASNSTLNTVGTLALTLTAASGTTAAKVVIIAPTTRALGQTNALTSPNYQAPTAGIGVFMALQTTDAAGLGVSGQTVLVSTDKGFVVASPAFAVTIATACGGNGAGGTATAKSITLTTASTELLTPGGTATPGAGDFILCTVSGNTIDSAGQAAITVSNISTAMANATTTVSMASRPGKITAVATGNAIQATVTDANGNNVADGTPIRFTMSANAGASSVACTTSTNGQASTVVALIAATGSVIVSSDWSEAVGTQATCAVAGSQQTATSVVIGAGAETPPVAGAGTFAAAPVYSASKLAQAVFNGGTVAQLDTAITAGGGTGAWAQDSKGVFVLYIVNGGFVNDAFRAAFPTGFAGVTALTVVGK